MNIIRARFCPSPTGTPHVGMLRTALFNFAFARHVGGQLVFRIEDTDVARDSEESYHDIIKSLRWLGISWDEGPDIGGPYGPYRQSQRGEIYHAILDKLKGTDWVYQSYSTPEEVNARHIAAGRRPELGYDNYDRQLTQQEIANFQAEGRPAVWRLKMPDHALSWHDKIRGKMEFAPGSVPDFPLTRANGDPLYAFVNCVDDTLMHITHILRGEDLLPSTPRQLALYEALSYCEIADRTPEFAHLPYVMGQGNKKLSKRDPEASFFNHIDRGMISEGLMNYLALLGWGYSADNDIFNLQDMIEKFEITQVNSNPARFDQKKADAINAEHIRLLTIEDFTSRLQNYLVETGKISQPHELVTQIAPYIHTRIQLLSEAWPLIEFLFVTEAEFTIDTQVASKNFGENAAEILSVTAELLENLSPWEDTQIETEMKRVLLEEKQWKPRQAFGAVRAAVSGAQISPPLFESIRILGKEQTLQRLKLAHNSLTA